MNLAVRHVTGKDPDAYLSDYRNHHHMRMQEVKEAIGVESRSTLFNPNYIGEMMKGGASAANTFSELLQNSYGWNVMKPQAIGSEMWDEIYQVYVKDKYQLGLRGYFERENAAALQEMVLKKEELQQAPSSRHLLNNSFVAAGVLAALLLLVWVVRRRRKNDGEED